MGSLPVQSGSDKVLNLMNRKHTIKNYLEIFNRLKNINPNIKFSSDFIIAYPGEEESDFRDTIKLIDEIKFINSFSFIFSPRPGTKAAKLEMINKEITKERLIIIQKKLFNNQFELNQSMKNSLIEVLVENKLKNQNKYFGRNKYLSSVIFNGDEKKIGKLIKVKIEECNQNSLFGKIEKNNMRAA